MAMTIKEKLGSMNSPTAQGGRADLVKESGEVKISGRDYFTGRIGGMRGVKGLVCDTSVVEPDQGLIIREQAIMKIKDKLPEEIFWLLLIGEFPSKDELAGFQKDLKATVKSGVRLESPQSDAEDLASAGDA